MRALASLFLAAVTLTPAAQAQVIGDAEVIRLLMLDHGLTVRQITRNDGEPLLEGRVDETNFNVHFYDCHVQCDSIQFSAGFDLDAPLPIEMVNLWNRDRRFGKVYLDETGDPFVEMDISLAGEGVGRRNFDDLLDTWRIVLSEFRDFIDW